MIKFILHIVCLIIYPFSFLIPRSKKIWAFGSYRGMFNDNSKYLFIFVSNKYPEIDAVWLSTKKSTVNKVRSLGLRAYWVISPVGLWMALRSKYWIVNSYTSDILFCLSGGAIVINLWHGIGLKKCEFNITNGPLADRYVRKTIKEHITHPEAFRRPDLLLTVSDFQTEMFAKAFRLPYSKCLKIGYPRNEMILMDENKRSCFINRYENEELKNLIAKLNFFNEVFIYMPTWRDSQVDIFAHSFDLNKFNEVMVKRGSVMLLKLHPNTKIDKKKLKEHSNIILVDNSCDVYPLLAYCNVLITDYSSILYDFILKPDAKVILYLYDYTDYQELRDFYFPFHENVIGVKTFSFDDLARIIENNEYNECLTKRQEIVSRFWGSSDAESACDLIFDTIKKYNF